MSAGNKQPVPCSAGADCGHRPATAPLAWADWDLMFRAALEYLARGADEKTMPPGTAMRLQARGTVLRACVDELDHLRRSLPTEQAAQGLRTLRSTGDTTPDATASQLTRPV